MYMFCFTKINLLSLLFYIFYLIIFSFKTLAQDPPANIKKYCEKALEFYLDRPDLETEFKRRLEFCKTTITDVSPEGYEANPIISDFKSTSLARRSLKPRAWIIVIAWLFFAVGPGAITGNDLFGKPGNIESWSFGMPSIWVWKIIFWILGILLIWFLAIKMEMSTAPDKPIISQTEDIGGGFKG